MAFEALYKIAVKSSAGCAFGQDLPDPCNPGDPTCYCIPLGICYNITQQLVIDNCWMDRHAGHDVEVRYVMFTLSGYKVAATVPVSTSEQFNEIKILK